MLRIRILKKINKKYEKVSFTKKNFFVSVNAFKCRKDVYEANASASEVYERASPGLEFSCEAIRGRISVCRGRANSMVVQAVKYERPRECLSRPREC